MNVVLAVVLAIVVVAVDCLKCQFSSVLLYALMLIHSARYSHLFILYNYIALKHKAAASKTPEEIAAAAVLQQVPPSVRTVAAAASAPSVITTPVAAAMDAAKKA